MTMLRYSLAAAGMAGLISGAVSILASASETLDAEISSSANVMVLEPAVIENLLEYVPALSASLTKLTLSGRSHLVICTPSEVSACGRRPHLQVFHY